MLPPQVAPPAFDATGQLPHQVKGADAWAFAAQPGEGEHTLILGPGGAEACAALELDLVEAATALGATGRAGEVHAIAVPGRRGPNVVFIVGVGPLGESGDDLTGLRKGAAALARAAKGRDCLATALGAVAGEAALAPIVAGLTLASFEFSWRSDARRGSEPQPGPVSRVVLCAVPETERDVVRRAVAAAEGAWLSRLIATVPSNLKNPAWMVEQARAIAGEHGLKIKVWDEKALTREGFGGILAVGRASATPPRLVQLDYAPGRAGRRTPHVVLVGKGITFDTGGLNIKPMDGMASMKRDVTGAAVVLGVMSALSGVGCPVKVSALLPLAENAISGDAMRPGDVITHWGGRTTEITNTDAEGRLILADALAFAAAQLKPDVLVDIATLTGAIKVALGLQTGGYFANDDQLAASVQSAADAVGEPMWRLPLAHEYDSKLASKIADSDNACGGPGAIMAALFLQPFTGGLPWAHLDIASVGDAPADRDEYTAGPTGFGTRLLLHWLSGSQPLEGIGS